MFFTFRVHGLASETNSKYVAKLKFLAGQMDYYPLECHVFPAAQITLCWNTSEIPAYFEFTTLARSTTEEDRESCISYLDSATPKERALILVVLFFSQKTKYLPLIANYLSDTDVAFTGTTKDVIKTGEYDPTWKSSIPFPRDSNKAPENTYMNKKWHRFTDSSAGYSEMELTRNRPLPVSAFAAVILGNWGCFPDFSPRQWVDHAIPRPPRYRIPDKELTPRAKERYDRDVEEWEQATRAVIKKLEDRFSDSWSQFDHRKKLLRSWHVKYLVEVCSFPIESAWFVYHIL